MLASIGMYQFSRFRLAAGALALFATSLWQPAAANDSTAEMGAGGLVMVRNWDIKMESEELSISPDKVSVDYVFRNTANAPKEYLVAFPMPDIEPDLYIEGDIGIPNRNSDNLLDFKLTIDGVAVTPQIELRALSYGLDVTRELTAIGVPLNPLSDAARKAVAGTRCGNEIDACGKGDHLR